MAATGGNVPARDFRYDYCKATQITAQTITNSTFTSVIFDSQDDVDTLGIHDPVTNNTRLTIGLRLGWWYIVGKAATPSTALSNERRLHVLLNGIGINGGFQATPKYTTAVGFWTLETSTMVQSTLSTDYVELQVLQSTGGSISTSISGDLRSQFLAVYLGA